jgi:putative aldouronate transport system substrate-binding protein
LKQKVKGIIKTAAVFTVISAILLSCSTGKKVYDKKVVDIVYQEEGWKQDTSPITFDWYINYSWFNTRWGNDEVSKYVTEKTGVSINFLAPSGDESESLKNMMDKGKLPDIITLTGWDEGYLNVIKNNLALPLDELAEKYDSYFMKVADKQKLEWYRQNDGHVYCYPNYSLPIKDFENFKEEKPSNQTFLVRKDIYEAIGSPDMRTPESFLNALIEAKEKFPSIDGQSLIPFGIHEFNDSGNLSIDWILPNFLAIPLEKEGKLYDRYSDKEFIRWMKTLRKANELGLLAEGMFYENRPQIEEKIVEGRYFALLYQRTDLETQQLKLYSQDKNKIYIPVDGPANSNLDEPTLSGDSISGWTVTLISKTCKNPERAIKFLSYLISEEGNKDLYLGKENGIWQMIDGKEQYKPEILDMIKGDKITFYSKYGAGETYWMLMDPNYIQKWKAPQPEAIQILEDWPKGKTYNFSAYDHLSPHGDSEEGIIYTKINSKWKDTIKELLLAKSDEEFDRKLKEYQEYEKSNGNGIVAEYEQKVFEENKKKLSIH